jgi:hypothetical protein
MQIQFESTIGAHMTRTDEGRVRQIRHSQSYWETGETIPRLSAQSYLRHFDSDPAEPAR